MRWALFSVLVIAVVVVACEADEPQCYDPPEAFTLCDLLQPGVSVAIEFTVDVPGDATESIALGPGDTGSVAHLLEAAAADSAIV